MVKLKQGNRENNSLTFVSLKTVFHEEILGIGVLLLDTEDGQGKMHERKKYSEGRINIRKIWLKNDRSYLSSVAF